MRGWVRFSDGRAADPLALLQVVDALPPASFDLGLPGWAPTVELTVYLRGLPAPGWLACVLTGQLWQGGWFDEEAEVWDSAGRCSPIRPLAAPARPAGDARLRRDPRTAGLPAPAAIIEQLVDVYRAAWGRPFHDNEVEAGWSRGAGRRAGEPGFRCGLPVRTTGWSASPTATRPSRSLPRAGTAWSGRLSGRPPPSSGWPASSPSSGSPSTPTGGAGASAAPCWSACSPGPAPTGPG